MKIIVLFFLLFTYSLQSQTTFLRNTPTSQLDFFNSNLDKLTDKNGGSIFENNSLPEVGIILNGESTGDNFGYSVATAGDVNGDGFGDVIIGARYYDLSRGRVYIFYGGIFPDNQADVIMTGVEEGDQLGYSVSTAGDINNDGFDDIIVGNFTYVNTFNNSYIYFGGIEMNNIIDVTLIHQAPGANMIGVRVSSAGDVNGDGFDDVLIRILNGFNGGWTHWLDWHDLSGNWNSNFFGYQNAGIYASSAGDLNGDGYDDIILRQTDSMDISIYFGGSNMNTVIDINFALPVGFPVECAGDVNGDGFDDVIIGAHTYQNEKGRAYLLYGGINIDTIPDVILAGENDHDRFGWSVSSAGDLNGDGFDDVIVGANGFDSSKGKVYVYYGGNNMDSIPEFTKVGENSNDNFSNSISTAADMNGDGYDEIIVGANNFNQGNGRSYIINDLVLIAPELVFPENHSINNYTSINFRWEKGSTAVNYVLKISKDSIFNNIIFIDSLHLDTSKIVNGLQRDTKYYWKVEAKSNSGFISYSTVYDFTTIPPVYLNLKLLFEGLYFPAFDKLLRKDSVTVYLRGASSPFAIIDSARSVIDSNYFTGSFTFHNTTTGIYYIVVKHFNSIETWSKTGGENLLANGSIFIYDFTISNIQAYGKNLKLKGSKYCLYTGDVNQDGFITLFDVIPIYNDAANFVYGEYLPTDLTGDSIVDLTDVTICYNNSTNFIGIRNPLSFF